MKKFNYRDDFLAKWASGDLSDKEKEDFMETEDYKGFKSILDGTDLLEVPVYNKVENYNKVQKKISKENKVISFIPKWTYGMVASIVLLIGYLFLFNETVSYETGYGQQMTITLPDNSEVILNSKSKMEYNKKKWEEKRTLILDGEAYFKVNKGSTFTVDTDYGTISVLGTMFTVNSGKEIFEIACYEGKVNVETSNLSKIIKKGEAARIVDKSFESWFLKTHKPSWLNNESSFTNAPLSQVIQALEKHYNLTINSKDIDTSLRFTGSFTHHNVKTALSTVFESMDIEFTSSNNKTINLVKN